ncbi:hypothetical protein BABINDRAFT_160725 [Babjeviella inositovora NRRL Y-12698]|uniref:Uncharacterized protein n=1 Tax=Babjeviella inositovora NRRL Y-12698 TaxID=984486 RepID=A0A1E3QWJ6_9ASCO|nr:uncharacterized protein BABINDRAFT_160725 [Babjeviella inositovora NRRL Y-12698]ODQ81377.1 hypothetical protein BABINDRAFT_160725 [Babjeviella inositovora NRRL Y-12698]
MTPYQHQKPLRISLLGAERVGKTTFARGVKYHSSSPQTTEAYYPTKSIQSSLLLFQPSDPLARAMLDEACTLEFLVTESTKKGILLSPLVTKHLPTKATPLDQRFKSKGDISYHPRNDIYGYEDLSATPSFGATGATGAFLTYKPPLITPVTVELIDTPAFKPHSVVPYLEVALNRELGKEVLRKLADAPRQPVSTNPLLVASGASEMNGSIDGYIFMYSSVPSLNPPSYGAIDSQREQTSLDLLDSIKNTLSDAWVEFVDYKRRFNEGKESDVFSLSYNFRRAVMQDEVKLAQRREQLRAVNLQMKMYDINFNDPMNSTPPILIVCTHSLSELASPELVKQGQRLAASWGCGFIGVDTMEGASTNAGIEEALSMMIREISEKRKYAAKHKKSGKLW